LQHLEKNGEPIEKICAEHSHVIPAESYTELGTEPDRLRSVALLQQKAQALDTEVVERREIEKSLRRRESELAEILENAVEGVQQVGPDQRILWANKALLKLLGYSAEEYVNHQLSDFHVDEHLFEQFWQKLMRREDVYDYPAELKWKDGPHGRGRVEVHRSLPDAGRLGTFSRGSDHKEIFGFLSRESRPRSNQSLGSVGRSRRHAGPDTGQERASHRKAL